VSTHVYVGDTRSRRNIERLKQLRWGRLFCTVKPTPFEGERWAFDNGAFWQWTRGLPFDEPLFERRMAQAAEVGTPQLAIVPDIVAAGCSSLQFSLNWRARIEKMAEVAEWPWYLAVQDGMTIWDVKPHLDRFAGVFLGGTDGFKTKAWTWCRFAHDHGKKFHYGRAGTLPKMKSAVKMGADSLDSAFPLWTEERFETFWKQYDGVHLQRDFPYMEKA
jgi:hypothetical protein